MSREDCVLKVIPWKHEEPFPSRLKKLNNAPSRAAEPSPGETRRLLVANCQREYERLKMREQSVASDPEA